MAQTRAGKSGRPDRFSTVPPPRLPSSTFDLTYSHETTISSGLLYPIHCDEVLPGDVYRCQPLFFARMATPLRPFMTGLHLDYQFFYTPLRLLWDNFVKMMGEQENPGDHTDYTIPQTTPANAGGFQPQSIADMLGMPTFIPDLETSALFHRNYALCWNEWYRDENLQDVAVFTRGNGPDDEGDYPIQRRGKRKDYLTGALPFAQKGDPVDLPIGGSAPLLGILSVDPTTAGEPSFDVGGNTLTIGAASANADATWNAVSGSGRNEATWVNPALEVDLSAGTADLLNATGASVNDMRVAVTIQHLLERDARGGTRYREKVKAHWDVTTDDIRLYRPELLATGSTLVQVNPVEQTVEGATPGEGLGDLGAFAIASQVGRGFMKRITEHGIILGLLSVRADLTYQQGHHRRFTRKTALDFAFPDLQTLGEQAVESREIYCDNTGDPVAGTGDYSVWGYQPRYEEYRHRTNMVTGVLRSNHPQSLDIWHLALDFMSRPVLNADFIEDKPPVSRVVQVNTVPQFILDTKFLINVNRKLGRHSVPGLTRF